MLLPLLIAAAQPAAAPAPAPANVIVDLVAGADGRRCLPDNSLCLEVPATEEGGAAGASLIVALPSSDNSDTVALPFGADELAGLWPRLIVVPQGAEADNPERRQYLVGIVTEERAMYSGGGGSGSRLHLLRLDRNADGVSLGAEVLDTVWDSSLMIRACFSEQDMKDRLEACHDEYRFTGALGTAAPDGGELPSLTLRTTATAYPLTSRRTEDNSAIKLKKSDLAQWKDPECSYTRLLHYNPATARYEMDRPAPDCSVYTTP